MDDAARAAEQRIIAATPTQLRVGAAAAPQRLASPVTNYTALAWGLWEWLVRSKGVSRTEPVADAVRDSMDELRCDRPVMANWTYMSGSVLSALASLYRDSHNGSLLWWGSRIANLSIEQFSGPGGVLLEGGIRGSRNPPLYKGIFVHGLSKFIRALSRSQPALATHYSEFICNNARSAFRHAQVS